MLPHWKDCEHLQTSWVLGCRVSLACPALVIKSCMVAPPSTHCFLEIFEGEKIILVFTQIKIIIMLSLTKEKSLSFFRKKKSELQTIISDHLWKNYAKKFVYYSDISSIVLPYRMLQKKLEDLKLSNLFLKIIPLPMSIKQWADLPGLS